MRNITYIFQNLDDLKLFEEKGVIKNKNVKIIGILKKIKGGREIAS